MKKITTLIAMACVSSFGFTQTPQSQRLVLAEEFTQASCGPCAAQNPAYNAMLSANTTKVVAIKYQTSWPGVDPMNAQTQADVQPRVTYYSVTGVPNARLDGTVAAGAPSVTTQTAIDNEYAVPSSFTINLSHNFNVTYDSVFITMQINCTQNISGTLMARVAMVEKTISFSQPPGTNGETTFYSVMRKFFPSANGTTLPASWTTGQTQTLTFAAPVPNFIYDKNQIAIVAWIQDDASKNVKQAAISQPQPMPNDAAVTTLTGVPVQQCTATISPTVTIKNNGTVTMTSCTVNYKIDNNAPTSQPWTGSLTSGQTTTVNIASVTVPAGSHTFTAYTSNPNGSPDYNPNNDSKTMAIVINSVSTVTPLQEGYENAQFPPNGWALDNPDNGPTWVRKTGAGGFGNTSACAKMDFYNSPNGQVDEFYMPIANLSSSSVASLTFNVAYAQYQTENDKLEVKVSTNCGSTWTTVFTKFGTTLSTAPATTLSFTPTSAQWRNEIVNLNTYANQNNVLIKFTATSNYGNNMYIDDINLTNTTGIAENTSINSFSVYPNPVNNSTTISMALAQSENVIVNVYNMLGEVIQTINPGQLSSGLHTISMDASKLNNGVYFVKITAGSSSVSKKVVVEK